MKAFVAVISALVAAANAQLVYNNVGAYGLAAPAIAPAAYAAAPAVYAASPVAVQAAIPNIGSTQYQARDELGQFSFGHASPLASRQESRDAYGVTRGSYSQIDANGQLQITNYVADPINGFRVAASNLPIAPVALESAPLEAPVFKAVELNAPVMTLEQVPDTEEVAEAKAKFFEAYEAEKNREKRSVVVAADVPASTARIAPLAAAIPTALNYAAAPWAGYGYAAGYPYAGAYATNALPFAGAYATNALPYAGLPYANAALPAATYATALPAAATYAAAPVAATYAAAPVAATYAAAAPAAAAAIPSVKTTIKLNPGHAVSYRVDPIA